jgi:hypothetical protein
MQFVQLSLCNPAGQWSDEYYTLDHIKENRRGFDITTLLVLRSEKNSACLTVDASFVSAMKFNKYLQYDGALIREVNVHRKKKVVGNVTTVSTNGESN